MRIAVIFPCPFTDVNDKAVIREFDPANKCDVFYYTTKRKDAKKVNKRDKTLELPDDYKVIILVDSDVHKYFTDMAGGVQKFHAYPFIKDGKVYIGCINPRRVSIFPMDRKKIKQAFEAAYKQLDALKATGDFLEVLQIEKDYQILESKEQLNNTLDKCKENKVCILDIETSDLYPHEGNILGVSLGWKDHMGHYAPINLWGEDEINKLRDLVQDPSVLKTCHNISFEMKWLEHHFKIPATSWTNHHDTMALHYVFNENLPADLKVLAVKYTDLGPYEDELDREKKKLARQMKIKLADFSYAHLPLEILGPYACKDVDATAQVLKKFYKYRENPAYKFIIQCSPAIAKLELVGGPISVEELDKAIESSSDILKEAENELFSHPAVKQLISLQGKPFNPNSYPQVGKLLYEVLELPVLKRTDTGAPSTAADVLEQFVDTEPLVEKLMNYRKLKKFLSTYLLKIREKMSTDGRLRTRFNITRTTSGRLSSSGNINYQNIPRGKSIKRIFVARDGYLIFQMDLRTAEVWVAAAESEDPFLIEAFESGMDFHGYMAKHSFGLDCEPDEVKVKYPEKRQAAKAITFGLLYGAQAKKISTELGCTIKEAEQLLNMYFSNASRLKKWIDEKKNIIQSTGKITSRFGRTRRVPEVFSPNNGVKFHAINSAFNFIIQSAASDINLSAFSKLVRELEHDYIDKDLILPWNLVHDSMIFEVKEELVPFLLDKVRETIEAICREVYPHMSIPIGTDFEVGKSWGDLVSVDEYFN